MVDKELVLVKMTTTVSVGANYVCLVSYSHLLYHSHSLITNNQTTYSLWCFMPDGLQQGRKMEKRLYSLKILQHYLSLNILTLRSEESFRKRG